MSSGSVGLDPSSPSQCCGFQLMIYSVVIVAITISRGSFVFSQSCVKVSASLTNVGSLAVGAFDLVNCSLSVAFNVGQ